MWHCAVAAQVAGLAGDQQPSRSLGRWHLGLIACLEPAASSSRPRRARQGREGSRGMRVSSYVRGWCMRSDECLDNEGCLIPAFCQLLSPAPAGVPCWPWLGVRDARPDWSSALSASPPHLQHSCAAPDRVCSMAGKTNGATVDEGSLAGFASLDKLLQVRYRPPGFPAVAAAAGRGMQHDMGALDSRGAGLRQRPQVEGAAVLTATASAAWGRPSEGRSCHPHTPACTFTPQLSHRTLQPFRRTRPSPTHRTSPAPLPPCLNPAPSPSPPCRSMYLRTSWGRCGACFTASTRAGRCRSWR